MRLLKTHNLNKILFIVLLFSVSTVHAEMMPPTVGTCGFYLQLEQEKQCGPQGYLKSYGFKYCRKFLYEMNHEFSAKGKVFVQKAGQCLQSALWNKSDINCLEIKNQAISSHGPCYYHSGFCQLSFHDKMVIFSTIKKELFQSDFRKQALKMLKICQHLK